MVLGAIKMLIEDLNLFVRVAQTQSLSEAARQLEQTPGAVSAKLKRIEKELRVRLVERTTRSLRLTPEGERFLQICSTITMTWNRGESQLRQDCSLGEGKISIAAPSDTSALFLGKWISEYGRIHPKLEMTLRINDRMHELPREAVDIAIRYGELTDSTMVSRLLARTYRVLVASPDYLTTAPALNRPEDLLHHRCLAWLMREQPKVQWTFKIPSGDSESVNVKPVLCGDGLMVRQWAILGEGIAYKAFVDVASDIQSGALVQLLTDYEGEYVPINIIMPSGRYMAPRVRGVVDYLVERFSSATSYR